MREGSAVLQPSVSKVSAALVTVLSVMVLFWCMADFGLAQNTNSGDIRGTVTDATGAVVPGVTVTLLNTDTGVAKELVTNSVGLYDAVSILPGHYRITFEKSGFGKVVRDGIDLTVGAVSVDAQLAVGQTQQAVAVTGETVLLATETAEQATNLSARTMDSLPNVNQDWQNIVKMIPGASGTPSAGGNPDGNGQPDRTDRRRFFRHHRRPDRHLFGVGDP